MKYPVCIFIALLLFSGAAFAEFVEFPVYFCGINQPSAKNYTPERPLNLTDAETEAFKEMGVNTIRVPLYPEAIGIPDKMYYDNGRTFDRAAAEKWPLDWSRLDGFLEVADVFFDCIFVDWDVYSEIKDSEKNMIATRDKIKEALARLETLKANGEKEM